MEFQLKSISLEGVDEALSKVETYRFLNQPEEAESICHDVLAIAPGHQLALRLLGLAITDQFTGGPSDRYADAENTFLQLSDPYERLYYTGLLHERRAKAQLAGSPSAAYSCWCFWKKPCVAMRRRRRFVRWEMTMPSCAGTVACA